MLNNVSVAFILNSDEVSYNLWFDKKMVKKIITPKEILDNAERRFGISRNDQNTSFFACISIDGFVVPGQIIFQCKKLSSNILGTGVVDLCKFVRKDIGCMDIHHFLCWLEYVFVQVVNKRG